jgi:AcrR family transcriptional regulator
MVTASRSREPRSDAARNQQALVRAAITAVHREGTRVPMATIAADAGVGIGTLYRHFPTREDLLNHLTHASFEQVLVNAEAADSSAATAAGALWQFIQAAISQRNELVLPLHGGPPAVWPKTRTVRERVHQHLQRIIDRGRADGTITREVTPYEIVALGAMLAQPRPADPTWDATCLRLLATYLAGLSSATPGDLSVRSRRRGWRGNGGPREWRGSAGRGSPPRPARSGPWPAVRARGPAGRRAATA